MKFSWNRLGLATSLVLPLLGAGCGGISASPSVNPLMFLVPGLGQARPVPGPAKPSPAVNRIAGLPQEAADVTGASLAEAEVACSRQFAQVR